MAENSDLVRRIAMERMRRLFELARSRGERNDELSSRLERRYVRILREISAHYRVRMPKEMSAGICKRCDRVLIPGVSSTVRVASSGYLVYRCECGAEKHVFVKGLSHA